MPEASPQFLLSAPHPQTSPAAGAAVDSPLTVLLIALLIVVHPGEEGAGLDFPLTLVP